MKLTIIGSKGMLGSDLVKAAEAAGHEVTSWDLPDIDITRPSSVAERITGGDWVINCAAFTLVDDAESRRAEAFAINGQGPGHIAKACKNRNIRLLHLSTDYVYDGEKSTPYVETDPVNPLSVYAQSKWEGEKAILQSGCPFVLVRTQSLFGVRGRNFVRAIRQRLVDGKPLRVVADQISSPTYTRHLADAILRLIQCGRQGIVQVAAEGSCSWYEFARAIVDRLRPGTSVERITAEQLSLPARRPANSVLNTERYAAWTGHRMPSWQIGLDAYLKEEGWVK